ncbi:glycosyltransferase family 4 protein [Rhizobium sp. 'Codium 1']|uniref:glycosyltransferase family 4 protein n=1 Tax=Rhizobium sp. 'Codium 1' TaxID=2940484 RepID=UPI001E311E3E|nr:glycosyltransferase family 4 protein [Rhizobium sp. 'Codium 1']MCC8934875.1 glycosyltransferase family 4 protein [Rhizobium sp. 'Codium 1']
MKKVRLAWISTHPIQYQAPLLRQIATCPDIELTALFFSDFSTRSFVDPEFNRTIHWDTPLLEGYHSEFLPGTGSQVSAIKAFEPRVGGLYKRLHKDNFDAVLVQGWQHYGMLKAAWLAKRAGLQVLMRCEATDHVASSKGLKGKVREAIVSCLLSNVDKCLAIGTRNRDFYLRRGFKAENIGSMPYCVDNDHFRQKAEATDVSALRAELGMDADRPVILYASKLMRRKFPDQLLQAYAQLPEPRPYLLYVGDGELRAALEAEVKVQKLGDVRFLGFRNQSELPAFYALADIFVLPSINETWGLVINEAMNAGCAIISTDQVGSAVDLVEHGKNGYVLKAGDTPALTVALNSCLDEERLAAMQAESLKRIEHWGIRENVQGLRAALGLSELE